jgi:hypothetical protein
MGSLATTMDEMRARLLGPIAGGEPPRRGGGDPHRHCRRGLRGRSGAPGPLPQPAGRRRPPRVDPAAALGRFCGDVLRPQARRRASQPGALPVVHARTAAARTEPSCSPTGSAMVVITSAPPPPTGWRRRRAQSSSGDARRDRVEATRLRDTVLANITHSSAPPERAARLDRAPRDRLADLTPRRSARADRGARRGTLR